MRSIEPLRRTRGARWPPRRTARMEMRGCEGRRPLMEPRLALSSVSDQVSRMHARAVRQAADACIEVRGRTGCSLLQGSSRPITCTGTRRVAADPPTAEPHTAHARARVRSLLASPLPRTLRHTRRLPAVRHPLLPNSRRIPSDLPGRTWLHSVTVCIRIRSLLASSILELDIRSQVVSQRPSLPLEALAVPSPPRGQEHARSLSGLSSPV